MDRRRFIRDSAILSAALAIPWLEACRRADPAKLPAPDFLSHTLDRQSLLEIGKAYLESHPDEKKPHKLADLLMDGGQSTDLKGYFKKKIRKDFENGDTTLASGWVLSVTEARQAALFSLLNKD
jgi:hypothetical protein